MIKDIINLIRTCFNSYLKIINNIIHVDMEMEIEKMNTEEIFQYTNEIYFEYLEFCQKTKYDNSIDKAYEKLMVLIEVEN